MSLISVVQASREALVLLTSMVDMHKPNCVCPICDVIISLKTAIAEPESLKVPEKNPLRTRAKLTEEEVREIRRLRKVDKLTIKALATQFGMSVPGIMHIINRKTWKHVE